MHPYLADGIAAYPVALVASIVVSALVGASSLSRVGLSLRDCVRLQLILTLAGIVGAKAHSLVERSGILFAGTSEVTHGFRYPGAVLAVLMALALFGRKLTAGVGLMALADALAPSIGVGAALLRVGCFLFGCCFGVRSGLPWALAFPADSPPWHAHVAAGWIGRGDVASLPVHPLQLYLLSLSVVGALVAFVLQRRRRYDGQVILMFLTIDQLGKFALEFLRHDRLLQVQYASLAISLAAAAVLSLAAWRSSWRVALRP